MKRIRIHSLRPGGAEFRDGGLVVGSRWTDLPAQLTDRQRGALRDHHGRFIGVHPEDLTELAELGLKFEADDRPLIDLRAPRGAPVRGTPAAGPAPASSPGGGVAAAKTTTATAKPKP